MWKVGRRAIRGAPGRSAHIHSARSSRAHARKRETPSGLERPFCTLAFWLERRAALSPPASLSAGVLPPPWQEGAGFAAARVARPPMSSRMGKRSAELISVAATAESSASFLVSGSGAHFWTIVSAAWQSNPTDAAPSPFCMVARTPIRPSSNSASLYMRRVMPLVASTTKPGRSKHTNAAIAPGRPACSPPSAVASWVDDGPGRHWVSAKRLACAVKKGAWSRSGRHSGGRLAVPRGQKLVQRAFVQTILPISTRAIPARRSA